MRSRKSLCKFNTDWLVNEKYKLWLAKGKNDNCAKCTLCSKDIDLSTVGANVLDSHAKGKKHFDIAKNHSAGLHCSFFRKEEKPAVSTAEKDSKEICKDGKTVKGKLDDYLLDDSIINAEILWTLECVMGHFSFHSCAQINSHFSAMFKDSQIAAKMKFGKIKCSYFINYGLAPYIKEQLEKYISSSPLYIVSFDESMNSVLENEQMDVAIRFLHNSKKQAKTRYLISKFLHRPNAENLVNLFSSALKHLDQENLLQLSMDGPSASWNVLDIVSEKRNENEFEQLLVIGSCSQHVLHGVFKNGVIITKWDLGKILKSMFYLFHNSPARRDIYVCEGETGVFL